MALDHWITHSILINLFIKPGLNNFLLPPLLSIIFVTLLSKGVQWSLGKVLWGGGGRGGGGTRKAYILPDTP